MLADFQIFLDLIALIQGLILAIVLMTFNQKNHSSFFLGLYVLFFSLKLVIYISNNLILQGSFYDLKLLPFNFSWLLFPLFLIYTYKVSVFSNIKPPYWVLVPGIISIIIQIYQFSLPRDLKFAIFEIPNYEFFHTFLGIFYSWAIGIWNLKILCDHKEVVLNSYTQQIKKELKWAHVYLFYSLVISILIHLLYSFDPTSVYFKILYSTFDLFAIYWIAFHGIKQYNVVSIFSNRETDKIKISDAPDLKIDANEQAKNLMKKIDAYLLRTELYVQSSLTIIDLAENLKIHPKHISTAINSVSNKNFNNYINHFRIQKAVKLLNNQESIKYSMEGIGYKVGFNSKSAFYKAFKNETGTTPIKYTKKLGQKIRLKPGND